MTCSKNDIVWIDTELTGLDIEKDTILEVACIITDSNLKIKSEEFNVVINQPDSVLRNMNSWCTVHHAKVHILNLYYTYVYFKKDYFVLTTLTIRFFSLHIVLQTGLIHESQSSKISLKEAEKMLLNFLKESVPQGTCPLAGNTIYMDRLFLLKHMPSVNDYLHYRNIDVSSIKELAKRWNRTVFESSAEKTLQHRALSDIKESIQELKHYKDNIFMS